MSKYHERNCEYNIATGNSTDLRIGECESEVRADVVVNEHHSVRLWGCVVNCNGYPVPNALVKLLKVVRYEHGYNYVGVAHTITDCDGLYQFDICGDFDCDSYKVIVSKAATGPERVIPNNGGNCKPCEPKPCDPKPAPRCEDPKPPKCDYYEKPEYVEPACDNRYPDMYNQWDCGCEKPAYQDVYSDYNYSVKKNQSR